jgi:hypothetical protein
VSNVSERETEPTCALIRMERDSVMTQEPASHSERVEILTPEIFVFPATSRLFLNTSE